MSHIVYRAYIIPQLNDQNSERLGLAVGFLHGIKTAGPDARAREVRICFDEDEISEHEILARIRSVGFAPHRV